MTYGDNGDNKGVTYGDIEGGHIGTLGGDIWGQWGGIYGDIGGIYGDSSVKSILCQCQDTREL